MPTAKSKPKVTKKVSAQKATPKTPAKKPATKLKSATKPPVDDAEKIIVTVKKASPKVEPAAPAAIAPEEDIPDTDLPSADELDLSQTEDPASMSTEQMEQWFDDLDSVDESSSDMAEQAAREGLSQAEIDYLKNNPIEDEEDTQPAKKPIESLVKPSPMSDAADDGGKLKGFIVGHARGARTEAAAVHQSAQEARNALSSPKVFDTSVVFKPIDPATVDTGPRFPWFRFLLVLVLFAAVAAYVVMDLEIIKAPFSLPFDLF